MTTKQEYQDLCARIERHNKAYYIDNRPEITDNEYDALYHDLKQIELSQPELIQPFSPTQYVGSKESSFNKTQHITPMLSLDNVYSAEEISKWVEKLKGTGGHQAPLFRLEPKYDGASIELFYSGGVFIRAVTRGDGVQGDDVTENVRMIKDVPRVLSGSHDGMESLYVRGEIYMDFPTFERLNTELESQSLPPFRNSRNAAAGSLRLKDSSEVAKRGLRCTIYEVLAISKPFTIHTNEQLKKLKIWGFSVPTHYSAISVVKSPEYIQTLLDDWTTFRRNEFNYPIDGIVIKIDRTDIREELGNGTKAPKWAVAYKFPAEQVETVLQAVEFSMGKTGAITPVAILAPVFIDGTKVERASMHNFEFMASLGVMIGSTVLVEKAAEIIPQIVKVVSQPLLTRKITIPTQCPFCGGTLSRKKTKTETDSKAIYCTNPSCEGKAKKFLEYFVGRDQMNIDSIGPSTLELLYNNPKFPVRKPSDLYQLRQEHMNGIEGLGEISIINIIKSIGVSCHSTFPTFLNALAIPGVGKELSKLLSEFFVSPDGLIKFLDKPIVDRNIVFKNKNVDVTDILTYFSHEETQAEIRRLLKYLTLSMPTVIQSDLTGKVCVVTGSFVVPREELEKRIEQNGGKVGSSVSKNTDYLVQGDGGGSKIEKAKALIEKGAKIKIINETELLTLLK